MPCRERRILLFCLAVLISFAALAAPGLCQPTAAGPVANQTAAAGPAAATPDQLGPRVAAPQKEKQEDEGPAPVEKRKIDKKPKKYGAYIYRDEKFIRLPQVPLNYSGVWFPISLTTKKLAACFFSPGEVKDLPVLEEGDLLVLHFKGASRTKWYYFPLTRFARCEFPGNNEAELWQRPEGFYPGFVAIGNPRALNSLFRDDYEDGYRFEQRRIRNDDIVYKDKTIVFARVTPIEGLPISRFAIMANNLSFNDTANFADMMSQLPEEGALFRFGEKEAEDNFAGKRDYIERYNQDVSVRYMVAQKEFTLQKDKILETGIFVKHANYIRFMSDEDFYLVMRENEWARDKGWMPPEEPFGEDPQPVPLTDMQAYEVKYRSFALRFESTVAPNQIRLMGTGNGTKVTIFYSPLYDYEEDYQADVRAGMELVAQKKWAQAEAEFNAALKKLPDYPEALSGLARLYLTSTDKDYFKPKKALGLAIEAARFKPVSSEILFTVSLALYANGDLDRSLEALKLACGRSETDAYSKYCRDTEQKYQEIKDLVDEARRNQDYDPEEALKGLHFALEKMPNNFKAMDRLAWLYTTVNDPDLKDPEMGLSLARNAYAIANNRASILDTLAEAFYRNGKEKDALAASRRALYWAPYSEYYQKRRKFFMENQ